ncbi:Lysine--tRNA ligase [Sesbania bispinosa]|nr:Lysine--tRNA ligase [Sesbania bispinosa]
MMPRQQSAAAADNANLKKNPWVPGSTRNPETYILKDQRVKLGYEADTLTYKRENVGM